MQKANFKKLELTLRTKSNEEFSRRTRLIVKDDERKSAVPDGPQRVLSANRFVH